MRSRHLLIAVILTWIMCPAHAADTDTKIHVSYAVMLETMTTPPRKFQSIVDTRFTLKADGSVEDNVQPRGGDGRASNRSKLGDDSRVRFRVIDDSTIERIVDQGNYVHRITVRVTGKNCMAEVKRELKPDQKFFRLWNMNAKRWEDYRSAEALWATCVIE